MSKTVHLKWSRTEDFEGHYEVEDDFDTTDDEVVMDFVNNLEVHQSDDAYVRCSDLTVEAEVAK